MPDSSVDRMIQVTHECAIHEKITHRVVAICGYETVLPYLSVREQIRILFQLDPSDRFVLTYLDGNSDSVSIVNDEELKDAVKRQMKNSLVVKVVRKCSHPHLRVLYGQTQHLLTLPQSEPEVCYNKLHSRVRNLFQLPNSVKFAFSYKEPDSCEPYMTVANDEVLKYVLEKESQKYLRLDINIVEEGNTNDVGDSHGERTSKTEVVTISHNGTVRALALTPVELKSSCEQFLSRIREVFTLRSSTQLELSYRIDTAIPVVLSKGEKLKDALSRQASPSLLFASVVQKTSYIVKVSHNGTLRRLTLCSDEFHFSYENFRTSIRGLFRLPPSTSFVLNYIDEDQDNITIMEDEDLRDALVLQSLHPFKVNMVIIERDNDINLNPQIAQPSRE